MRCAVIFMVLLIGCSSEPASKIIFLEISPDYLILEKRPIKKNKFEAELKAVIHQKLKEGLKREDLTIQLEIDEETKRGEIADLETAMRHQNVRKVIYSTLKNEKLLFKLE